MTYLLFENAWLLGILLFLINYAALVTWRRRRTTAARRALLTMLALSAVLLIAQRIVVTDREAVRAVLTRLVDACRERNLAAIDDCLDHRFAVRDLDRAAFLHRVDAELERVQLDDARLTQLAIQPTEDGLKADFTVSARGAWGDLYAGGGPTYWRALFRNQHGQWRLLTVDPRPGPGFPFQRLEQLLGR